MTKSDLESGIKDGYELTINGSYSVNQLVRYSDIEVVAAGEYITFYFSNSIRSTGISFSASSIKITEGMSSSGTLLYSGSVDIIPSYQWLTRTTGSLSIYYYFIGTAISSSSVFSISFTHDGSSYSGRMMTAIGGPGPAYSVNDFI